MDSIISVVVAVISLAVGLAPPIVPWITRYVTLILVRLGFVEPTKIETKEIGTHTKKLQYQLSKLIKSSEAVDEILLELTQVAQERSEAIENLEKQLANLASDEQALTRKIQDLQNVPLPVAEHFAKLTEPGEKRSAQRDYILFISGVVVSAIVSIILSVLGVG